MIIYCIKNTITNKLYVGQTVGTLKRRFSQHCSAANSTTHSIIDKSIDKHGKVFFQYYILEKCNSLKELNQKEEMWIKELNTLVPNGYNLALGGKSHGKMHLYTKQKMSKSHIGKIPWNKNKKCPQISKSNKGRIPWNKGMCTGPRSKESKLKQSQTLLGNRHAGKRVLCINNQKIYLSISEAARDLDIERSWLQKQIKLNNVVKGYKFKYVK